MKGVFISIEGPDRVGKSTQGRLLRDKLRDAGVPCILTKEPSDDKIGIFLRKEIHGKGFYPETEALLFAADRLEHYRRVILPSLNEGKVVISVRYLLSSLVYQSISGVDIEWIEEINKYSGVPDLTIVLLSDNETIIDRIRKKKRKSKFESEEFQEMVIEKYRQISRDLSRKHFWNIEIIETGMDLEETSEKVMRAVSPVISKVY